MRKISVLFLSFLLAISCVDAQNSLSKKSNKNSSSEPIRNPVSLPLGIDTREVRLAGRPGSANYAQGIQEGVREKITSANADATRYLEKAVKEDPNNLEKIKKLLDAGASAYITYEMIDNKQYDLIDLMHKSNPKLIRFSQLLHHACSSVFEEDTTMVDFLIDRGASLDLCGYYWERVKDPNYGQLCFQLCQWNSDFRYQYTPQDVAWNINNIIGLYRPIGRHIINKYGKYPTTLGIAYNFYCTIIGASKIKKGEVFFDYLIAALKGEDNYFNEGISQGNGDVENALTKMLNTEIPWIDMDGGTVNGNCRLFGYRDILTRTIELLGETRKKGEKEKSEKLEEIVRLMIEKGAKVDNVERKMSVLYMSGMNIFGATYYNTPLLAAMKEPNMLDIIKLLKEKGAPMKIKFSQHGRTYEIPIKDGPIRDEYKEAILLGDI